ncbi:four helix bundle protein [uncultured Tenacibaculum sp.]|uniref:four helix bundle protein n=1 Tax=uncultured Tenacibaculum sp. TaxID=174713 RepID=UPI00260F679A|nr:four helix bundle protein [uncultured Tenacibaculum sp.]
MRNYKNLEVWKKSHQLALKVYEVTKMFSSEEKFGIISQLRRASLSIPTNLVEGASRNSEKEFAYFINIASGSSAEVEYLLEFSKSIAYLSVEDFDILSKEVIIIRKMLNSLYQKLK